MQEGCFISSLGRRLIIEAVDVATLVLLTNETFVIELFDFVPPHLRIVYISIVFLSHS